MSFVRVRCPSQRCGIVFEPHRRWLGRNLHCPACGARMTARPLAVDSELAGRVDRASGGTGSDRSSLPFVVLVDNVRSLWNVGSIFRTADACGVRKIVLSGISGCPPRPEIRKTALGAEESVAWDYRADAGRALGELREQGYTAVALESTRRAVALPDAVWPESVCLVLGNEVAGVSGALLEACPLHVAIPMRGTKGSFNVAVAFGIAGFAIATALASRAGRTDGLAGREARR
jgi:tRNA G18 (ribose-2'-O)-methylase SpoU